MLTDSSASRTCGAWASASEYTATERTPSSWQARTTRSAISPRLAMRTFFSTGLERDVAVLLRRILVALPLQRLQRVNQSRTCVRRIDDVVHVAARGGDVRVRKLLRVLVDALFGCGRRIFRLGDLLLEEDLHRALRAHHGDLGGRPRDVVVATNVL